MKLLIDMNLAPRWAGFLNQAGHEDIGSSLLAALKLMEGELIAGALLTLEPARTRVRLLPLRGP